MEKYRWSHPQEWLTEKLAHAGQSETYDIAMAMLSLLDGDQIQDLFQSDMDSDGYFDEMSAENDQIKV